MSKVTKNNFGRDLTTFVRYKSGELVPSLVTATFKTRGIPLTESDIL